MAIDERSREGVSPAALARPMAGARSPAVHAVLLGATIFSATLAGGDVDRRALFDIGAAGPWAGFVVALVATVVGLAHSTVLAEPPRWHGVECGDSLLTAFLTRAVLHVDSATVVLHPVAFAGWFGLFVTSLNLIPVGQLDGGHVLYAAVGRG